MTGIVCWLPHLMLCPLRAILEPHAHAMTTIIDPSVREQMPTCCLLLSLAARWIASTSERCWLLISLMVSALFLSVATASCKAASVARHRASNSKSSCVNFFLSKPSRLLHSSCNWRSCQVKSVLPKASLSCKSLPGSVILPSASLSSPASPSSSPSVPLTLPRHASSALHATGPWTP